MIEIDDISVAFGSTEVLHQVTCKFHSGQIIGFMGRNGSGKSVLLKTICGLVIPSSGKILIDGKQLTAKNAHSFSIGALIETPGFLREYSGYQNLHFIASLTPGNCDQKIKNAMAQVGLDWKSSKRVSAYSLGMRQRLGLAQALLDDPDILILDEPMNGLDADCTNTIRQLLLDLSKQGKTILLASHYEMDLQMLCTEIYKMDNGYLLR